MHTWQNCCFSCFYCRIFIVILDIFLLPDRFCVLVAFLARRVFCANLILKRKFSFMQVFSAFGFVHKITTFEKTAGFQVCMLKLITQLIIVFWFQHKLILCVIFAGVGAILRCWNCLFCKKCPGWKKHP